MTGASIKMKAKSKKSMAVQTILRIIALGVIFVMVSFGTGCSGKYCVKTAQAEMDAYYFDNIDEAKACADKFAHYGYQVYNSFGKVVYTTYSELVADILSAGKKITDFVRESGFKYGHAPMNPAMDCEAKIVSCDRFVGWALYEAGFTDQPEENGIYVFDARRNDHDFETWSEKQNFIRIDNVEDLQAGDYVFVNPTKSVTGVMYPAHTFLYAGHDSGANHFRYDCGSDHRIQSVQPSSEPINNFMFAYRPVTPK